MYACVFLLQGRVALADCKEVKYKSNQIKSNLIFGKNSLELHGDLHIFGKQLAL